MQQEVTTLGLYSSMLAALPCILASSLLGPWSDTIGRKPIILIPMVGHIVAQIVFILNVYFWVSKYL